MAEDNPFDHLIQTDELDEVERLLAQERKTKDVKKAVDNKSLMELLAGSNNTADLARKFNVDPDMSDKVLVPVLNFLDKYGVGETITTSDSGKTAASVVEFLTDITPIVRNAMDYFAGKQRELSDEDRDFLNQIKDAQSSGDMGLFIGETIEPEEVEEVSATPASPEQQTGQIPVDTDIFTEGVNWVEVLSPEPTPQEEFKDHLNDRFLVDGLQKLADEAGLDMEQVILSDRQSKTNNFGRGQKEVDYTEGVNLDLGLEKINEAMKMEKQRMATSSKIAFTDNETMPVPTNLTEGNPMEMPDAPLPTFQGTLDTIEELSAEVEEVPEEEQPWQEEEFNPNDFDKDIAYPTFEAEDEVEPEVKTEPEVVVEVVDVTVEEGDGGDDDIQEEE